jgi:hypothetical protein
VLARDPSGLELRADPTALAPERLLVFEVRGPVSAFANAVRKVPGLELIDEEELARDDFDQAPVAYLMVPDNRALRELVSLWRRWQRGERVRGETPWHHVFSLLRDLRPWGPADRIEQRDATLLAEEIDGRSDDELVRLEVELIFRSDDMAAQQEIGVRAVVLAGGGSIVSRSRITEIAYHALLVDLPVPIVRQIIQRLPAGIAGLDPVMHIRPQSTATSIQLAEEFDTAPREEGEVRLGPPILALLDGVPVAAHPLLERHIIVDDPFGLEAAAPVADRVHGTAMASLIIHGDRNQPEAALPRQIIVIPVLGARDSFVSDRLVVDAIYQAVIRMREGDAPTAPGVLLVNLSLGNRHRQFQGQLSPWARLLDRLAYRFGILFFVSAGNNTDTFGVPAFTDGIAFENASAEDKAGGLVSAIGNLIADRRLFSPAETVNGITVGACNEDSVPPAERIRAHVNIDPYSGIQISNPSSALGPGFAQSVKPDILLPGAREYVRFVRNDVHIHVQPARPTRSAGLKVAAPPLDGRENALGYTGGTSAATALGSRTAHRIHDALEAAYGPAFTNLPHIERAVLLKALLIHPARWPPQAAALIRSTLGPADGRQHVRQKDNIRRFLGYGRVEQDDAVACAADRATFWAVGALEREQSVRIDVPVPVVIRGIARPHAVWATLAWLTPVSPGRRSYRTVRLKLLEPDELDAIRVEPHSDQPDTNQSQRGTVFTRCWIGDRAPAVAANMSLRFVVQREPDQVTTIDEPVPFGLAITLTMPGVVQIYDQVRQRIDIPARARA